MANQRQRNIKKAAARQHARNAGSAAETVATESKAAVKDAAAPVKDTATHVASRVKGLFVATAEPGVQRVGVRTYIKHGGGANILRGSLFAFTAGIMIAQAMNQFAKPIEVPAEEQPEEEVPS